MVPRLACAEVASVDGFNDLDAVGVMTMINEERREGKLDSGPDAAGLEIVESEKIRTASRRCGVVHSKFPVEVVAENAGHSALNVLFRHGRG